MMLWNLSEIALLFKHEKDFPRLALRRGENREKCLKANLHLHFFFFFKKQQFFWACLFVEQKNKWRDLAL